MILVNISAVATSTTFTLIPVSSSHLGPEKLSGSSACRPASQTIVMVWPLYFCASRTAISAALSAIAVDAQDIATPATAPTHATVLISLMVSLPFTAIARRRSPVMPAPASLPGRPGISLCRRALGSEAAAIALQPRLEARVLQHGAIDHAARHAAVLDVEDGLHVRRAIAGEALIGPAQGVRRQDHVVELQDRIVRRRRLLLEHVEPGARDAPLGEHPGQRLLIDDRPARGIDEIGGRLHQRQALGIDEMPGLWRQRTIDAQHIGTLEQILQPDQLDPELLRHLLVGERVVRDEFHVERSGEAEQLRPDIADADRAQ